MLGVLDIGQVVVGGGMEWDTRDTHRFARADVRSAEVEVNDKVEVLSR